jgi:hypothetical protein
MQAQTNINAAEAASTDPFTSRWRPFIGWVCGVGFGWNFIGLPIARVACDLAGHPLAIAPADMSEMMPILLGMLGLGGLRTYREDGREGMTFFVILFAALADRMRGGFPERRFWGRDIVRMAAWYASGALVAMLIRPDWWCLLAGVLYAQGDRQDMSVMAELIRPDGKRLKGWLGQFRIGAVFAACVAPMLAVDLAYWPMVVAAGWPLRWALSPRRGCRSAVDGLGWRSAGGRRWRGWRRSSRDKPLDVPAGLPQVFDPALALPPPQVLDGVGGAYRLDARPDRRWRPPARQCTRPHRRCSGAGG